MILQLLALCLGTAFPCANPFVSVLEQLESVGKTIEEHFPIFYGQKGSILIASNALKDAHVILMTLAQGAVEYPFCFPSEFRLNILRIVVKISTLAPSVFRSYFHAFQLGKEWFYSVDARNHVTVMEIVGALHHQLSQLHGVLVEAVTAFPTTGNYTYVLPEHTETGAFVPTELLLRKSFPEVAEALTDKGLLRALVRSVFPIDSKIADLGALDGQYSRWLNDTGLVQASAFDGMPGVESLTDGAVSFFDLTDPSGGPEGNFDFVLCLEVAEHISNEYEHVFLSHLRRLAKKVVISWSASAEEGIGHVNPKTENQVQLVMSQYGFALNADVTNKLRNAATIPWIKDSVSLYESSS